MLVLKTYFIVFINIIFDIELFLITDNNTGGTLLNVLAQRSSTLQQDIVALTAKFIASTTKIWKDDLRAVITNLCSFCKTSDVSAEIALNVLMAIVSEFSETSTWETMVQHRTVFMILS